MLCNPFPLSLASLSITEESSTPATTGDGTTSTTPDCTLDPKLIDCGNVSVLSFCEVPYTFTPKYNAPNGCSATVTPIDSKKCTACNKDGNIFERDSDECEIQIDGDNVTISEVAGDDDYVQIFFNVSDGTSTINAMCTFCIDEEPSDPDGRQLKTKGCGKGGKGRRRAFGTRKESYTQSSEQEETNLRGLKSTKKVKKKGKKVRSFTCPSNWTAYTSLPECPAEE